MGFVLECSAHPPREFQAAAGPSSRLLNSLCFGGVDYISLAGLGTSGLVASPPRANECKWIYIAWIRRATARVVSPGCIGRRGRRWRLRRTSQRLRRRRLSRRRQSQARLRVCVCVRRQWSHALQQCFMIQCPKLLTCSCVSLWETLSVHLKCAC